MKTGGIIPGTSEFFRLRQSNEVPTWLFWSCDAIGISIMNGTTESLRSRQLKRSATWLFYSYDTIGNDIIMPTAQSVTPLHSLGQCNWNEVLHDNFDPVMPLELALVSHDTNCVINGIFAFSGSQWLKLCSTWLFHHVTPLMPTSASHDDNGIVNSTTVLVRSIWSEHDFLVMWCCWQSEWHATWLSVMWCCWHHHWHHLVCQVETIKKWGNMNFWSCHIIDTGIM